MSVQFLRHAWLVLSRSPIGVALVVSNRLATFTSLVVAWRKLREDPNRFKRFLLLAVSLNLVSLLVVAGTIAWVARWR